jgi:cytochrome c-type biogenesis protein CcmE
MKKNQRLYFILLVLASLGLAAALTLYALKDNVSFFYSPQQLRETPLMIGHVFRLGGLVKEGSLQQRGDDLAISFVITDKISDVRVMYEGILPDLFREGQGVVAKGSLNNEGVFVATELLAKHDENYMPPEVARALKKAHEEGKAGE